MRPGRACWRRQHRRAHCRYVRAGQCSSDMQWWCDSAAHFSPVCGSVCSKPAYTCCACPCAAAAADNTTCKSDAGCTGTSVCSTANPVLACKCTDGVDTCENVGQCVDFCATQQALIDKVAATLPTCTGPFDQSCGAGEESWLSTQLFSVYLSASLLPRGSCYVSIITVMYMLLANLLAVLLVAVLSTVRAVAWSCHCLQASHALLAHNARC